MVDRYITQRTTQNSFNNFEDILNDEYCKVIIQNYTRKYSNRKSGLLDDDDVNSTILEAAYEAYKKYDPNHEKSAKFTSYLHYMIGRKLGILNSKNKKVLKKNKIIRLRNKEFERSESKRIDSNEIKDILMSMNEEDRAIIIDKFWGKMTNQQIAKKYHVNNQETMRLKIKKILESVLEM